MIRLENVSKIYPTAKGEVYALRDVSLDVAAGEFVAVRGPSGCGKSTLLSLVGGLAPPSRGQVIVADQRLGQFNSAQLAAFRARHVGFVFQMFHLLPYLPVIDNVLLAATPGDEPAARQRALAMLTDFGLGERLTHRPGQLSAGERQRVAMARALLNQPNLLLADEPTGNLDPESAAAVMRLIGQFHQDGGTVLLVTHDETAASAAQRTILMRAGSIETPVAAG